LAGSVDGDIVIGLSAGGFVWISWFVAEEEVTTGSASGFGGG
jgi:hypothetical protein